MTLMSGDQAAASGRPHALYYGWYVVAAVAACEMMTYGTTTFSIGLFVKPLGEELGISRADANTSIALMHIGAGIAAPLLGLILDRWSIRHVLMLGALFMSSGLLLISQTCSVMVMALSCLFLLSIGFVSCGVLTSTTAVSRWFLRRRGRAMGVVAVATSAGGVVVTPLVAAEIAHFGWRGALVAQAVVVALVIGLLVAFVIRNRPADIGRVDDMEMASPMDEVDSAQHRHWTYRSILGSVDFWFIGLSTAMLAGGVSALLVTLAPYASDLGISSGRAALLISVLSMTGIVTKLGAGWISDLVDRRWILTAGATALAFSLALLSVRPGYPMLLAASAFTGMALGTIIPAGAALTADRFGAAAFGKVYGLMHALGALFNILAVRGIGEVFDRTGDYRPAFLGLILLSALSGLAPIWVRKRAVSSRTSSA